ncbi:MAG: HAMP domain-containing protein [Boseongicola sp.]|nr:MAG: HAMP domain-containing protein [Boseongicola sp.]
MGLPNIQSRNPISSIFMTCVLILAGAIAVVAGTMYSMSAKSAISVAEDGVRTLALDVTKMAGASMVGAVRFNKSEDVEKLLGEVLEANLERIQSAFVAKIDGNKMAEVGDPPNQSLQSLAELALSSNQIELGPDGFQVAAPILKDAKSPAIAVIAFHWSPRAVLRRLEKERTSQLFWTGGLFITTLLIAGLVIRQLVSMPLRSVTLRTVQMAEGEYTLDVPGMTRRDEIGELARQLEELRSKLHAAEATTKNALFQSGGFQASSAGMVMTNADLKIMNFNNAFKELVQSFGADLGVGVAKIEAGSLAGLGIDTIHRRPEDLKTLLAKGQFPFSQEIKLGASTVAIVVNQVKDDAGGSLGYILEWKDITADRTNKAVIDALDSTQMRADFDVKGVLKWINSNLNSALGSSNELLGSTSADGFMRSEDAPEFFARASRGEAVIGTFDLCYDDLKIKISGSFTPTLDNEGKSAGFVMVGSDITEAARAHAQTEIERSENASSQKRVVEGFSKGLTALSAGDLAARIDTPFSDEYDLLRLQFNDSVAALDTALGTVLINSASILGESGNISSAAKDLSQRTERQATTLKEFAAALTQLNASVSSAADGANQASEVVSVARSNAESSGSVMREAVEAMGEIATSSDQISRIISVIDDIAFQTNLLALNAGVEAARAGDAGRGFAVVASEVRALAQRSSEAAREINTLISTSGNHVKRGVSLVDKAGDALAEIVDSVGNIAEHVTGIASSAREQSIGLDEINASINQLDQVTQQNVAMFEETTAATVTLTSEANALVSATGQFTTSKRAPTQKGRHAAPLHTLKKQPPTPSSSQLSDIRVNHETRPGIPTAQPLVGTASGNLAHDAAEDDWEDF